MKKSIILALIGAMCLSTYALSLAEASAKIGNAVKYPERLTETMRQLSASDQVAYIARVNAAIAAMPGSPNEKAATFLKANKAAMRGASKGNIANVLAEIFATASLESLTIINERFAIDLFNRDADPKKPISDERMAAIAKATMEKIAARLANEDNSAVRKTFAVLMFVRASKGTPTNLRNLLMSSFNKSDRQMASSEWIPPALGENQSQSYDPMLGISDAGETPDLDVVLYLAGPQYAIPLLPNMFFDNLDYDNEGLSGLNRIPLTESDALPWFPGRKRGEPLVRPQDATTQPNPYEDQPRETVPYFGQDIY